MVNYMLNPISITAPTLKGEGVVDIAVMITCFIVSIGLLSWFTHKIWSD